jgi:hypothetical protein
MIRVQGPHRDDGLDLSMVCMDVLFFHVFASLRWLNEQQELHTWPPDPDLL